MRVTRPLATTLMAAALFASSFAYAEDRGSKDEAKAMAEAAAEHVKAVGPDKASKDFMQDKAKWTKKDLYVFMYDMKGTCLANGANEKLVGKNLMDMKDKTGKPIIAEFTKVAKNGGSGWVDYEWAHPQTQKVEGKTTYVMKVANFDGYVGVGAYR